MASAMPINDGIAGQQRHASGECFTFGMGTAQNVAEPTTDGTRRRPLSQPGGHRRLADGDGHPG